MLHQHASGFPNLLSVIKGVRSGANRSKNRNASSEYARSRFAGKVNPAALKKVLEGLRHCFFDRDTRSGFNQNILYNLRCRMPEKTIEHLLASDDRFGVGRRSHINY